MTYRAPNTLASRVSVLLLVFSLPLFAPQSPDGDGLPVPGTPKVAQASGIPTVDIAQVFGHLGNFGQMLSQISEIRAQYELVRDNFRIISKITGWEGLNSFFKPIDKWLTKTFDPIIAGARAGLNTWNSVKETYFNDDKGSNKDATLQERLKDAGRFTYNLGKDVFMEPAKANKRLSMIEDRVKDVKDCLGEAKGRKQTSGCMAALHQMGVTQMTQVQKAIAKQTALIASRGMNSQAAKRHRRGIVELLRQQQQSIIRKKIIKKKNQVYQTTPRRN